MAVCVAILAGLVTLALLFRPLFGEFERFQDWLDEVFLPNITSISVDGDLLTQAKLFVWEMSGFMVGLGVYVGFRTLFG